MAAGQKKIYIAKDGEILYGEQRDEYLHDHASDDDEFADSSEMYIKGGNILHGREALKEKMADDVRDALRQSGMNKWLDKLENEVKEKKKDNEKQSEDPSDEKEGSSAMAVAENLSGIHKKLPSKVQNSAFGKTLKTAEDACKKQCDGEHTSTDIAENVVTEIHKKLPSKIKSVTAKGLEATKGAWKAGQGAIKTATEAGKVIQDALTGDLPELNVSGDADFTGNFQGNVTPMQKESHRVKVGEAQLQLQGRLHGGARFSSKINGKTTTVDGEFDGAVSADAEFVGADIEVGHNTKQETHKVKDTKQKTTQQSAAVEATTKNEKTYKVKARFEGQASASAKGVNVKINTHKPDKQHTTGQGKEEVPDFEMNATAQAQATGINVDIMTTNKPKPKNDSSEKKNDPKPKLRVQGRASASATAADVKIGNKLTVGKEPDVKTLEAHAHAEAKGCEVQIGNRIEKPKFKGGSASAKVQASGAALRVANMQKSESEKSAGATAEARVAGAELNVGNVNLDKGSSLGVAAVKEVKTGLTAFNVQAGVGGKSGIKASTDAQFGNVTCNLGPPALNISPFAFNLGFGGGIKGSAGTAAKESKGSAGKEDGSKSDGCEGNTGGGSKSNGGSHENRTDANYSSHNTGYASGGSFSTINGGSNNEISGSGSQFGVSDNSTANNNGPIKITNAQNGNYSTWHSKTSSHWGDVTIDPCATNEGIRSRSAHGLGNIDSGSGAGSNLHNAGDENGSILYLEGNSHSASQFAYGSNSSTSDHVYNTSSQHRNMTAGHTDNTYGNRRSSTSGDNRHSGGYGRTHGNSTVNYSTNNAASAAVGQHKSRKSKSNDLASTSTAAATGQATNRKSSSVNGSRPALSTDDQATLGDEENATFYNPHRLPRKLNEEINPQANAAVSSKHSSQGHQTSDLQPGKHSSSSSGLLGGSTHFSTKNEVTSKNNSNLLDDDLSRKLSLALSKSEASSKKAEKSKTTTSRQETKQKLTEELTKVRKKLEAEDNSTGNASSTDGDNTAGQSKESTSSSKSMSADVKSHSTDQQATDHVEEVAIPDEKKKPFGTHSNIFTMDYIRASTYKVQTSNKPLQKIGSNVMGFK